MQATWIAGKLDTGPRLQMRLSKQQSSSPRASLCHPQVFCTTTSTNGASRQSLRQVQPKRKKEKSRSASPTRHRQHLRRLTCSRKDFAGVPSAETSMTSSIAAHVEVALLMLSSRGIVVS